MAGWLAALTIGLPWLGALGVWLARDKRPYTQSTLAVLFSLAAAAAALALLPLASSAPILRLPFGPPFGDLTLVPDGLGVLLTLIAALIGWLAVIFSVDYMHGQPQLGRYYALVLLFIGAMAGLALSGSLMWMFVFWEMTALCSYALISFNNDDPRAVAGGLKALIITQVGGLGLLAGALTTYQSLGTFEIEALLTQSSALPPGSLALIAFAMLAAAAAKSAQAPFHTWLPDAMEAPTPVSALIHAATMVNAGIYLLARFYPAFAPVPGWRLAVTIIGVLSLLLGGLMALTTFDLKRVLAFSTISQLGYLVYATGAGGVGESMFHLLSHAVFKALLFLSAGAVIHATGTRDMRAMGGLGRAMPFVRNTFSAGALALMGLPPFNGFVSKELLLEAGLHGGPLWAYAIALAGAGLTSLYITRALWLTFFAPPLQAHPAHDTPAAMGLALAVLAAGVFGTWLTAGPFSELLGATLPHHDLHAWRTPEVVAALAAAPATYLTLLATALGAAVWAGRSRLERFMQRLHPLNTLAARGFGFETVNQQTVGFTQRAAEAVRRTQTGQLNLNLLGLAAALAALLALAGAGVIR